VNCDSILNNPDFCVHCGLQYERKPGILAGQNSVNIPNGGVPGGQASSSNQSVSGTGISNASSAGGGDSNKRSQSQII
jgi:hypothetical protein